ncbi:MAG: hypothetical protein V2A77_10805 [Pseudomonadota bacterium]
MRIIGANGTGKSTALEAIQDMVSGRKTAIEPRDGQRQARVTWGTATMTVGRSTRRSGELACLTLEGKLDLSDLVDPGLKEALAADARRIKALVGLSGRKADLSAYHELVGGRATFEALVKLDTLSCTDPVDLAARVKRDIESAARREEEAAEKQTGQAMAFYKAADGVDLKTESDEATLMAGLEAAIKTDAEIRQRVKSAMEANQQAEAAKHNFEVEKDTYHGPTVEEAESADTEAKAGMDQAATKLAEAEAAVKVAQEAKRLAYQQAQAAGNVLACARGYAALEEAANRFAGEALQKKAPDAAEAVAASDAVTRARRALENGATIRRARLHLEAAEEAEELARIARNDAVRLREAARATDDVLSQMVACPVLRVDKGRLVTDSDRGVEPFAELSHGERWRIALDIAIDRLDELEAAGADVHRLIVVSRQEAWEGLDETNRRAIHQHAIERRVTLLVAEATDGELRAEVYRQAG